MLRSLDGGENWERINQGLARNREIISVAIHPSNPEIIYAGMFTGGVYRSDNGGDSWQHSSIGLIPEAIISSIAIDQNNPDILYAADQFSGVYRSQDGGQSWELFSESLQFREVNRLILSADSAHLYAATEGGGVYRRDLSGYPPEIIGNSESDPGSSTENRENNEQTQGTEFDNDDADGKGEGSQFCPTSYLPFLAAMVVSVGWKTKKEKKRLPAQ